MNRLAMKKEIRERVLVLAQRDKADWREAEQLRRQFVSDYPISKIINLSLDEYVIGKGSANKSFCYRLERELDSLGRILGATAFKFGIYFGKTKNDSRYKYRFAKHWGQTEKEVFASVKNEIASLLKAASAGNYDEVRVNKLSPMFKGKLLFIYFPNKFTPIYAKDHLKYFLAQLNLRGNFTNETDMQVALMEYRSQWQELENEHPCLYMKFLYDVFGYPSSASSTEESRVADVPLLDDAIKGAKFIDKIPKGNSRKAPKNGASGNKTNYDKRQKRLKQIGDRGEEIVLAMEKQRLKNANVRGLASKVKHVALTDDSAGFDILSFDEDGTKRYIEVKATTGETLNNGFYISANEATQANILDKYYIYFVLSAMSDRPRVMPVPNPFGTQSKFELTPIIFHANLKQDG
ncbi:MAG: DUF3883 domain-containing protein [Desulfarculaceae bacterium]|nr:DUF3883 domain-containing protein [Desulfarculaceae bacterium]